MANPNHLPNRTLRASSSTWDLFKTMSNQSGISKDAYLLRLLSNEQTRLDQETLERAASIQSRSEGM